jgi:hypothetical protein
MGNGYEKVSTKEEKSSSWCLYTDKDCKIGLDYFFRVIFNPQYISSEIGLSLRWYKLKATTGYKYIQTIAKLSVIKPKYLQMLKSLYDNGDAFVVKSNSNIYVSRSIPLENYSEYDMICFLMSPRNYDKFIKVYDKTDEEAIFWLYHGIENTHLYKKIRKELYENSKMDILTKTIGNHITDPEEHLHISTEISQKPECVSPLSPLPLSPP